MAFNRRIIRKLEEACDGNEAMMDYMRDIIRFEMKEVKQYKSNYEDFLKQRAREEVNGGTES